MMTVSPPAQCELGADPPLRVWRGGHRGDDDLQRARQHQAQGGVESQGGGGQHGVI